MNDIIKIFSSNIKYEKVFNHVVFSNLKNQIIEKNNKDSLKIPFFQRDYVWKDSNIKKLFDSLLRGFPIGYIIEYKPSKDGVLVDGLQRTFSLIKLSEQWWKYLPSDSFDDNLKQKYNKYILNLKKKETWKECKDYINNEINDSKDFKEWFSFVHNYIENTLPGLKIPCLTLELENNSNQEDAEEDVTEIFERLNTTGKTLNKFEIYSANWSLYKIKLNNNEKEILDFLDKKEKDYKKAILIDIKEYKSSSLRPKIKNANDIVIPSDYMYATLYTILDKCNFLQYKRIFLKEEKNGVQRIRNIEAMVKLFLRDLKLYYNNNSEEIKIENLGKFLKKTLEEDKNYITNFKKRLLEALKIFSSQTPFLNFAEHSNDNNDIVSKMNLSLHMIVSMISTIMKELHKLKDSNLVLEKLGTNNLQHHIINEVCNGVYSAGPNTEADNAYESDRYLNPLPPQTKEILLDNIKDKLNPKNEQKNTSFSPFVWFIASIILYDDSRLKNKNIDADHVIPKHYAKDKNKNYNDLTKYIKSIYNLNWLTKKENSDKGDKLNSDTAKLDYLFYKKLKNEYDELLNDINNKSIKKFIEKRQKEVNNILNEKLF